MISSKMFYAIAAMVHISKASSESPVKLSEISQELNISASYVEQIFTQLRTHDLVEGVRGPGGGYRIAKPSFRISITDIIKAFEVPGKKSKRGMQAGSENEHEMMSAMLWDDVSAKLYEFLSTVTLANYSHKFNRSSLIPKTSTTYKIATMFPARQAVAAQASIR